MIDVKLLTKKDINRPVIYHRIDCKKSEGVLTSWNNHYVFVKFNGPNGAACEQKDVSFKDEYKKEQV